MRKLHQVTRAVTAGLALALLGSTLVLAQDDALAVQKRAVARIDAVVDRFRRTGDARLQTSELMQADMELAASNRVFVTRGNWSALSYGLTKQGSIRRMQAQWADSISFYQQAADAAARGRDVVRQADALAWRALAESSAKQVGAAFTNATLAVRMAETTADKDVLANALDILGTVQIAQRDFAGAGATLNREVDVAAQATNPMASFFAYLNRSDVYLKLGQECEYKTSFDSCYQSLEHARQDLQQASAIAQRLGYAGLVEQCRQFQQTVDVATTMAKSQQSQASRLAATTVFNPKKPADVLATEHFLAPPGPIPPQLVAVYQAEKQYEQQMGPFGKLNDARAQFVEGQMSEMRGDNDAALALYVKAVDMLERDRRSLHDERSRGTFAEDRINFYYAPILQLLDRRRFADAFDLLERSRSRALADLLAQKKLGLARPEEQNLYAESELLRSQIADAQGQLFELASQGSRNTAQLGAVQSKIAKLETQNQDVTSRIAAQAPRLQTLVNAPTPGLKALQQAMRDEHFETLQYLVLDHAVIVWHISADAVTVRDVFLPRAQLTAKVAALKASVADRNKRFDDTTAKELFLYLVQPVLAQMHADRVVVIPHEDLNTLPFQVFQNPADGRYLGERFQITYAPSVSVLLNLKRAQSLSGGRLFAVADPGIPAAGPEVGAIAKLFSNPKVVNDPLAREADVKAAVRDFDVIHLSVHGKFDASEPMLSYVALGAGGGDDGRLTAAEMFGLPLDNSRLVVLSACETGRAEATHSNEVLGIVRSLLYAGAGSLVLSYWEVDSDATALWMQTFYQAALTRPMPDAARAASAAVRAKPAFSHPYYWAAFGMIGR
ncbi:MAG TPA: CHAT domain-containing protein [Vicinamibacterales bacterium]|jgi:CHAT domain-containing protein